MVGRELKFHVNKCVLLLSIIGHFGGKKTIFVNNEIRRSCKIRGAGKTDR